MTPPTTSRCEDCGYDLSALASEHCPECGYREPLPSTTWPGWTPCPTCAVPIRAWTAEDCPGCGRPLDCEADNDELPPFGLLDEQCGECGLSLSDCRTLRCPACEVLRLLRFDFDGEAIEAAEAALQRHGLIVARRRSVTGLARMPLGAIWIRSNCWPSASWVLEAASVRPLAETPTMRGGFCKSCGYDLYGIRSHRCPECGERMIAY